MIYTDSAEFTVGTVYLHYWSAIHITHPFFSKRLPFILSFIMLLPLTRLYRMRGSYNFFYPSGTVQVVVGKPRAPSVTCATGG